MKLRNLTPAMGVLATSISLGDVTSVSFDQPLSWDMADVTSQKFSITREIEARAVDADSTAKTILPPPTNKWDAEAKGEYLELTKKHALQIIGPTESTRLYQLKEIRSRDTPGRTFSEIQADIEFHRNVESAIKAIQRLMSHDNGPYFASA